MTQAPRKPPRSAQEAAARRVKLHDVAVVPDDRIPRWLPVVVYALVTVVLFREFVFTRANMLGTDSLALGYFARNFYTTFVRTFQEFPLWDPLLFGGLPFVEGMHGDIFYPPSLALFFAGNAATGWGWKMVLHVFLAGVFMYAWLRGLGLRQSSAFFGGLVYMCGADLVSLIFPGGDGKLFVSALAPLMFWLTDRAFTRRAAADFALLALGLALVMFTSHMQLAYFTVWGISLYAIFRAVQIGREDRPAALRLFGGFVLAGVLGVASAAVQFLPPLGYLRESSQRAGQTLRAEGEAAYVYSTTYSLHPEEVVSLAVPEFIGDNVQTAVKPGNTYWGRNPFKINHEYAGLVPLLLLPLLFLRRRSARSWFFLGLAMLALLYAVGATTPLFRLFYLIPGVKLFRAPSLIIFLFALSITTLGALGLERYLDWANGDQADRRAARRSLWGVAAGFFLLALLASGGLLTSIWTSVLYSDITPDKAAALEANTPGIRAGFWVACFFAVAIAGVWEGLAHALYGRTAALAAVCFLAFIDLYRVDRPFIVATAAMLPDRASSRLFTPDDAIGFLQERQRQGEVFRALDLGPFVGSDVYPRNGLAIHGIEQLAGHHGNEIGRYRQLIGGEAPENLVKSELRLLDVTNTMYLVSPQPVDLPGHVEAFRGANAVVYRNPRALPRAYLVGNVSVVPDDQAVATLLGPGFDGARTALLPQALPPGITVQPDPVGTVQWGTRGVNEYELNVTTDRPALLVIAENYYDAWHAQVDGRETPVLRANYTFRAVPVPAGTHRVRLYYSSPVLRASAFTSAGLLTALALVVASGVWQGRRRRAPNA